MVVLLISDLFPLWSRNVLSNFNLMKFIREADELACVQF